MKKKVLITGASGFIGYHLIESALQQEMEVYAAVRPASKTGHLKALNINYTIIDFTSVDGLRENIEEKKYDYIVHAAGITKAKTKEEYNLVNARYTLNLAQALTSAVHKIEKLIFISSLAAIGPLNQLAGMLQNNAIARPVSFYGTSKLLAESYLGLMSGLPFIVIRPTAVYGPGEKDLFVLLKMMNKGLEPYIGRFDQKLSFIYVKDLSDIVVKALSSDISDKSFNVSDGDVYTRYAFSAAVKKALNKKTFIVHLPVWIIRRVAGLSELLSRWTKQMPALNKEKLNELTAINWSCDIRQIRQDLGFSPQYNLEKGMAQTIQWYKENKWL